MTSPAIERFRSVLRVPTVSHLDETENDWPRFRELVGLLEALYPAVHAALEREIVADHSVLWRWPGRESGSETVLMAHYDVVSVALDDWTVSPFDAELSETTDGDVLITARGALDDKGSLVAILEAVEGAIGAGSRPLHDIYILTTHNEETAGGAAPAAVELLGSRGIRPRFVLDEGGNVRLGILPGVTTPLAVVGVTERGIMNVELTARHIGGHASAPPPPPGLLATQRLARAITRLTEHPFEATVPQPIRELVVAAAPHADEPYARWFADPERYEAEVIDALDSFSNRSAAMLRTTVAVTMLSGSAGANVLPTAAVAIANVRINPGAGVDSVVARMVEVIDDPLIEVRVLVANEPAPVSSTGTSGDGGPYDVLREVIEETFPQAIVAPYVQTGGSDSRHFAPISDGVYRFIPFDISPRQQLGIHGADEYVSVSQFERAIEFYERLLTRL